jgi:type III secretory pathway component EscV
MSEEHFEVSVDDEVDVDDNVDDDKPGDDKPGDDEKPGDEKPEPEDPAKLLKDQVTKLESEKKNLNVALHQARQERKSKKTVDGEQLTDDQVEELIKEHGDDPKVLRNVVQYIAEQSTKGQIGIQETAQLRKDTAGYVAERWPDMVDES